MNFELGAQLNLNHNKDHPLHLLTLLSQSKHRLPFQISHPHLSQNNQPKWSKSLVRSSFLFLTWKTVPLNRPAISGAIRPLVVSHHAITPITVQVRPLVSSKIVNPNRFVSKPVEEVPEPSVCELPPLFVSEFPERFKTKPNTLLKAILASPVWIHSSFILVSF